MYRRTAAIPRSSSRADCPPMPLFPTDGRRIPIFPTNGSVGNPPVSCFHVSPPSVDLNRPLPGIFDGAYTDHGGRRVAHSDAYSTRGLRGSIARSIAPTFSGSFARNRI